MENKGEVLLLIPRMAGGGAERVIGILADGYAGAGYNSTLMLTNQKLCDMVGYQVSHQVSVVSLQDSIGKAKLGLKYGFMKLHTCAAGKVCEWLKLRVPNSLAHDTFMWQYHTLVEQLQIYLLQHPQAIVIAFLQPAVNAILLASEGLPNKVIISERADPARYKLNRYMPYFADKWYPKADCIVFQTESAQAYFPEKIRIKSAVIYNPLNPHLPEPYEGKRRKTVVNFCRMTPQKNLPLLVDAFDLLHRDYPTYTLEIWGEGESEQDIRAYITQKGIDDWVLLKPFDATLHEAIKDCAMFVSSSDYEGMSNSMLEALAIGLPSICTDCPAGGAKAIIRDGENGLLVPVGDSEALYRAMKRVIEEPGLADRLSRNAVALRDELKLETIARKWMELL